MTVTTGDKKKYKLSHEQVDKTVDSPCIQVCTYDEEELKKLIHIMFYGFKAYDFVLLLISILEKKTGNNETQNYKDLIKTINIIKK